MRDYFKCEESKVPPHVRMGLQITGNLSEAPKHINFVLEVMALQRKAFSEEHK